MLPTLSDGFTSPRGMFQLLRRQIGEKEYEVLVDDRNLVVTLGRRAMSRLISGMASTPTVLESTRPALTVLRNSTGSPGGAFITIEQLAGTNDFLVTLCKGTPASPTVEFSRQFTGGTTETITTLASWIGSQTNWYAVVLNSLGSLDASTLLSTPASPCLGSASSYATNGDVVASPSARTLRALTSYTRTLAVTGTPPALSCLDLYIDRIRFGTQGHVTASPTLGKTVLATDEVLTASLLASDYLGTNPANDYLAATVTYPNTGIVTFTAQLDGNVANGLDISEAALCTQTFMIARKNFGKITKSNSFELVANWSLVF